MSLEFEPVIPRIEERRVTALLHRIVVVIVVVVLLAAFANPQETSPGQGERPGWISCQLAKSLILLPPEYAAFGL